MLCPKIKGIFVWIRFRQEEKNTSMATTATNSHSLLSVKCQCHHVTLTWQNKQLAINHVYELLTPLFNRPRYVLKAHWQKRIGTTKHHTKQFKNQKSISIFQTVVCVTCNQSPLGTQWIGRKIALLSVLSLFRQVLRAPKGHIPSLRRGDGGEHNGE